MDTRRRDNLARWLRLPIPGWLRGWGRCNLLPAGSLQPAGMYRGEGRAERGCGPDGAQPASSGERKRCQNQVFPFLKKKSLAFLCACPLQRLRREDNSCLGII